MVSIAPAVSYLRPFGSYILERLAYGTTQNAMLKLVNRFEDTTTYK